MKFQNNHEKNSSYSFQIENLNKIFANLNMNYYKNNRVQSFYNYKKQIVDCQTK